MKKVCSFFMCVCFITLSLISSFAYSDIVSEEAKQSVVNEISKRSVYRPLPRSSLFRAATSSAACSLDIDGNGEFESSTDGLLILRYLFGFTGNELIINAVGNAATRTTADSIYSYLSGTSCAEIFDPDGDGKFDALTDQ
ncbi:exported hypothetical protein [Candidatus Magnetomoraceae bacterium gMMP-13]